MTLLWNSRRILDMCQKIKHMSDLFSLCCGSVRVIFNIVDTRAEQFSARKIN